MILSQIQAAVRPVLVLTLFLTAFSAYAKRSPWVTLTPANVHAAGITYVTAGTKTLQETHTLYGRFVLQPGAQALVTPRIRGRVTALYAQVGAYVKRGAPLARVESLLVGTPPPSLVVHAPMSGVVEARSAILGQAVVPGTLLYRLINPQALWFKAYVYQSDVNAIHRGQLMRIWPLGLSQAVSGRIIRKSPRINPQRGSETIWAKLARPHGRLWPALFARARVTIATARLVAVPSQAILHLNGRHAVFVVAGPHRFRYTPVTVVMRDHGWVGVSGLKAGSRVVTQGNGELYTLWQTGGRLRADS